ncbi:MAG: 5'-nucleotidase C-terminal domain-containing protein [Lachnospiraceae bacterium]|nr:5'-nucleotidase C-terminal domain-containing protein [Lachnospiraceae bacterium]
MNRKILALLLGVSMTLAAVTGCSSGKKETEAETKAQTEVQTEAKTEAKTEAQAAVEEAATEAEAAVEEAATEAEAAVEEAATEAEAAVEEAATEAEAAVEETATEAEAAVEEVMSEAEAAAEEVAEEAAETMTEAEAAAEEAASEAEAAVEEAANEAETAVEEVMSEAEAAAEEVAEEAAETMTEAEAAVEEAASEAEAAVEELMSEAEAVAEDAAEEVMSEVEEAAEETVSEAEAVAEEVMSEAEAALEGVAEAAAELMTEAEEAAEEAASEAEEAVESVSEDVVEAMTEAETEEATEAEAEDIDYTVAVSDVSTVSGTLDDFAIEAADIVILFNNDVHGGISPDKDYSGSAASLGYAGMAAVKADAADDAAAVVTVDLGDAIHGSVATTETDGKAVMDLMAEVGYDVRVPGNHEFDYGMDEFLAYAEEAGTFISSNFIDTRTGDPVFEGHTVITYEVNGKEVKIGFVGITTPETIAKSTPTYFQDEEGNYIYGFDAATPQDLYDDVQTSVDAAYADGADFVIAVAHLGDTGVEPGWSSIDVAANTTGICAFLDGHSHSVIPCEMITNKDGEDVVLASTGTKLENIGVMKLTVGEDNNIAVTCGLVNELTQAEAASDEYAAVDEKVQAIQGELAYLFVVEGTTDFNLVIYDPETGDRIIRNAETNLGDFLADIYLNYFEADAAVLNGGSIRANIEAGDITFMDIITVYPWNTNTGVVEVSGQVILDMLEMGAHLYPEECGGWILPAGMTYDINATIPSSVNINSDGEFVSVDGEYRVQNVMIGGEPLDLEKNYKLAINEYYSKDYGDGMTMFKGCKTLVPAEGEDKIVDHDVVIKYLESIGKAVPEEYKDPYGQGRINIITEIEEEETEAAEAVTEDAAEEAAEAVTEDAAEEATEAMTE